MIIVSEKVDCRLYTAWMLLQRKLFEQANYGISQVMLDEACVEQFEEWVNNLKF